MTKDDELIQQLWKEECLPCIHNEIIFSTGEIVEIKFTHSDNFPDVFWVEEERKLSLSDYLDEWDGGVCSICEYGRNNTDYNGYPNHAVVFGGSDYEGDGFIGLIETETGNFVWIMRLFRGSIIMGQYFQGVVYGFTEDGNIHQIPVRNPEEILCYRAEAMRKFMHFSVKRKKGEL